MTGRPAVPFMDRVIKRESGCWEWTGCIDKGYGRCTSGRAHRESWRLHCGPIPDGLYVCHRCDNKRCVNPAHLFLGSQTDNMQDAVRKGVYPSRRGERNGKATLTSATARAIMAAALTGENRRVIAERFGVTRSVVQDIVKGRSWSHAIVHAPIPASAAPADGTPPVLQDGAAARGEEER